MGEWRHGLFNCFDDFGICIIAYFVPCVVFGQNAEKIGEGSCCMCGTAYLVPIVNLVVAVNVRGKIREHSGIEGNACNDCLAIFFCPLCTLVQEAQEIKDIGIMSMARE